jgi:hypothetical protein
MRLITVLICFIIACDCFSQTKQQTIDWINSKIPKDPIVYGDIFKTAQKMKIFSDGSFELIIVDFEIPVNPFNPKVETTNTVRGNFKNLSPSSVTLAKRDNYIFIDINCRNNMDCLTVTRTGREGIDYAKNKVGFGAFGTDESNIGERLKKAFLHLVTLSGGKKEVF